MKNKIITLYELIGLIKDDKAPEKVKYNNELYYFNGKDYVPENGFWLSAILKNYTFKDFIELKIEIIEENNEWEDIEELDVLQDILSADKVGALIKNIGEIKKRLNIIIKNQKYLKDRLEEK